MSDFVSISNFMVNGQAVNAANAVIKNSTAADIRDGLKVEAEGTISSGVLVASRVIIRLQTNVRAEAGMQTMDTVQSSITLLGRTLTVNADTSTEGPPHQCGSAHDHHAGSAQSVRPA